MKAPFPYYGGKGRMSALIWRAFGDPRHYIEPFAGSAAVLLARPRGGDDRVETLNDADGHVSNVWRAIKRQPEAVAAEIENLGGVDELTLHAACAELGDGREAIVEQLRASVEWCDPISAARWIWGASQWIGGEWTICRYRRRPNLHGAGAGVFSRGRRDRVGEVLRALSHRLRYVRVACGDWRRVLSPAVLAGFKPDETAIFFDPPYSHKVRVPYIYAEESADVAADVREEAIALGELGYRVALCGMAGEHEMPSSWRVEHWQSGGLARGGKSNASAETIWLSPACALERQAQLFEVVA